MRLFERLAAWRRRDEREREATRAICARCHREHTPDPKAERTGEYCWWCVQRMSYVPSNVTLE